jgi:hypothetical protein
LGCALLLLFDTRRRTIYQLMLVSRARRRE